MECKPIAQHEPTPKELYQNIIEQLNNIITEQNKKIDYLEDRIINLEKQVTQNGMQ